MKTAADLHQRLRQLQAMKAQLLTPPLIAFIPPGAEPPDLSLEPGWQNYLRDTQRVSIISPNASLESLNAEIAALTWALSDTDPTE